MAIFQTLYQLDGARGFEADLEKASAEIRVQAERATRDTALAVRVRAQVNAPKDRGDLRANIAAQGKGLNWRVGILDVSIPSRGGHNTAHLNPWVYGVWYEYGFVTRKIAAQPFMGPAATAEEGPHVQRMDAALGRALPRAA